MMLKTQLSILGAIGAALSFAMPTQAQADICQPGGPCPYVELSGDTTCADAIAMIPSFPNGPRPDLKYVELLITDPASNNAPLGTMELGALFNVSLTQSVTQNNLFTIEEASIPEEGEGENSQITDLPGFEVAIVERNNSAIAYYSNNMQGGTFAGPGSQKPNKIRVCWAIGPCGLESQDDVNDVADFYNAATTVIDDLQAHRSTHFDEGANPINVCSLTGTARFCNTSIAPGSPGSCVPEDFAGSATTSVITSGIASTRFYSDGSGDSSVSSSDTTTTSDCNPRTDVCF